jgi:signal transduction histidine kinase
MSDQAIIPVRSAPILDVSVYLTLVVFVGIGWTILPGITSRITATALLVTFGVVHAFGQRLMTTQPRTSLYLCAQGLILTGLLAERQTASAFGFLFFVLGIQAMLMLPPQTGIRWVVLFYLISSASMYLSRSGDAVVNILFNAPVFFLTSAFGYVLRRAEIARLQNERLLAELGATQRQLRELAIVAERNRLARDLHDSAKQQAFAISAQLDAVRSLIRRDPAAAETHVERAEQLADTLRQELASLILELRPSAVGGAGLGAALRQYAAEWSQQSNIQATVHVEQERPLTPEVQHALFRIAQEALSNVARHSQAHRAALWLRYAPDMVALTIEDDGRGFEAQQIQTGVGTHSMRERAEALPQGRLALESAPGDGTRVTAQCEAR